jgi:hypothetical protein
MINNQSVYRSVAKLSRWLHIYLSMISFTIVFFFAVTGLTLNHAGKFSSQVHTVGGKGRLNAQWVQAPDTLKIDKLAVVEYLRRVENIRAGLSDFRIDDTQIGVSFKGPGYAADVFLNRGTGEYEITKTSAGFVGLINDLHKGRDTGPAWSLFIDLSAVFLTLVSLTGLLLMVFLKKKRVAGLLVALLGSLLVWLVYFIWIK